MREILFRGKRCDNGEWAEGFYARADHHWHKNGMHKDWIICGASANGGWFALHNKYAVKTGSVGQFTGLTDKNGKKIFDGDIVRSYDPDYPDSKMDCGIGQVEFYAGLWYVSGEVHNSLYDLSTICCKELEVIGNIHDDPELLEVE